MNTSLQNGPFSKTVTAYRRLATLFLLMVLAGFWPAARADTEAAWQALREGAVLLVRHTLAPGTGDPGNFRLDDCSTQRNLNETGRQQARDWGARMRQRGIDVGAVWSSQWCRTLETARLMDLRPVQGRPEFNSFFQDFSQREERTARARAQIAGWKGPGVLVVVSHQVNISALTGSGTRSGEGVVVRATDDGALEVLGRIPPP